MRPRSVGSQMGTVTRAQKCAYKRTLTHNQHTLTHTHTLRANRTEDCQDK